MLVLGRVYETTDRRRAQRRCRCLLDPGHSCLSLLVYLLHFHLLRLTRRICLPIRRQRRFRERVTRYRRTLPTQISHCHLRRRLLISMPCPCRLGVTYGTRRSTLIIRSRFIILVRPMKGEAVKEIMNLTFDDQRHDRWNCLIPTSQRARVRRQEDT
jgi:hypothetical protein